MLTNKQWRDDFRVALRHRPKTTYLFEIERLLDDADRCEQLGQVAKELADSLKYAMHYVPKDIVIAVPVTGSDKPEYCSEPNGNHQKAVAALARYEEVKNG